MPAHVPKSTNVFGLMLLLSAVDAQGYKNRGHGVTDNSVKCYAKGPQNSVVYACDYTMVRNSGHECLHIEYADGQRMPRLCGDATSTKPVITSQDIYMGNRLKKKNGNLQGSFRAVTIRCLDKNCDKKVGSTTIYEATVQYSSSGSVIKVQPRAKDDFVGKLFKIGKFICNGVFYYIKDGESTRNQLSDFEEMPPDVDLHGNVTCPDLPKDLCVAKDYNSVSAAGGKAHYLFENDCQTSSSLFETKEAPDMKSFSFIMDPIGELSGGRIDQQIGAVIVNCASISMTPAMMSTNELKPCRDEPLFSAARANMPNNMFKQRGLQTKSPPPLEPQTRSDVRPQTAYTPESQEPQAGTLNFSYDVKSQASVKIDYKFIALVVAGMTTIAGLVYYVDTRCKDKATSNTQMADQPVDAQPAVQADAVEAPAAGDEELGEAEQAEPSAKP
jgi:hypothetical protein|eukprot:COSAG01_NODE_12318_length_1760_cov_24.954814_1_plen_443_part_00